MKKVKNKYVILQGVMSATGRGDLYTMAYADTLKEANKIFNKLKKDGTDWGWVKDGANSYLETILKINDEKSYFYINYFTNKL